MADMVVEGNRQEHAGDGNWVKVSIRKARKTVRAVLRVGARVDFFAFGAIIEWDMLLNDFPNLTSKKRKLIKNSIINFIMHYKTGPPFSPHHPPYAKTQ